MATCYRHPARETGVSCSNCGNPICPDCMTATPVGMRCPECAGQKQRVHTLSSMHVDPIATYVMMAICGLLFLATAGQGGSRIVLDFVLFGPAVADGDYWRLVTSGFLHDPNLPRGFLHIGFNMYLLFVLGQMLEPALGHARFVALYLASIVCGSLGALLLDPNEATLGASGGVFGLMAATFVMQRARGIDPMQSGLGPTILLNLLFPFLFPGLNVSIGGHLGGLLGGFLAGWIVTRMSARRSSPLLPVLACAAISLVALAATYYEAREKVGL